jgi:hypothetical protein
MRSNIGLYKQLFTEIKLLEQQYEDGGRSDSALATSVDDKKRELHTTLVAIEDEQKRIKDLEPKLQYVERECEEGSFTTNGFVTFEKRKDAERALGVRLSNDDDAWVLETPPAADDVRYHDFEKDDSQTATWQIIGYVAVGGLFFAFMPIVIAISNVSMAIASCPIIANALEATGMTETVGSLLKTAGLTIMMAMLPTFLSMIFQSFFTLKSDRWTQLRIQEYYFWFLVLFVLLATSVGSNLAETLNVLAHSPFEVFSLFAEMMPVTTHFYLNYVFMQPVTHAMNLTRYIPLIKFLGFRKVCDNEERAKMLAEPEDQDYYGMGSRSARFTLMLLIGIVFGTICPLMNVVVCFNFLTCRIIYGYLIPFAESRKTDQGGSHWCMQLDHLQIGILIYLVMMTGILAERANTKGPAVISAISFLWWFVAYRKFKAKLRWEKLPYITVVRDEQAARKAAEEAMRKGEYTEEDDTWIYGEQYKQPEMEWTPAKVEAEWKTEVEAEHMNDIVEK